MGKSSLKDWPNVVGEFETIRKINKGFSISRFGDGEFALLEDGKSLRRMRWEPDKALTKEFRQIIANPHPKCLIGIPTMDPKGDKYDNWQRHKPRYIKSLKMSGVKYYSAFISRADCGMAWMNNAKYANAVRSIWRGKRIVLVSESYSKILTDMKITGEDVEHIDCPMYDAHKHRDEYEQTILKIKPEIAILSLGPAATILANRMAGHGIQAIDMGSIGGFLQQWPA